MNSIERRISRLEESVLGESSDSPIMSSKQLFLLVKKNIYYKKILELGYEVDDLIPARNKRGHVVFRKSYGEHMRYPEGGVPHPGWKGEDPYLDSKDRVITIKADEKCVVVAILWSDSYSGSGKNVIKKMGGKTIWRTGLTSDPIEGTIYPRYSLMMESDIPDIMETIYSYCRKMNNKKI